MLNEWKEFQDYTGAVNYTARNKQDTTYLGRFTFVPIGDLEGLNGVLTILERSEDRVWTVPVSLASRSCL